MKSDTTYMGLTSDITNGSLNGIKLSGFERKWRPLLEIQITNSKRPIGLNNFHV